MFVNLNYLNKHFYFLHLQQLENIRCLLHSIFYNLLVTKECRDIVLDYIASILQYNDRRTQFHFEEKTLARDGFMLNIMCVLQKLSVKIKLERIDPIYPHLVNSLVDISKDTKLKLSDTEYMEYIGKHSKQLLFDVKGTFIFHN